MKPRLHSVENTLLAYPTPIHQARYDEAGEFNAEIAGRILARRDASPGTQRSNVGGWHSDGQILQEIGEPHGPQLARMFVENIRAAVASLVELTEAVPDQFQLDAWANVNERGYANSSHIHPGCIWSGVYYVATAAGAGGEIVFTDPRTEALVVAHPLNPFPAASSVTIKPVAARLPVVPVSSSEAVRLRRAADQRGV